MVNDSLTLCLSFFREPSIGRRRGVGVGSTEWGEEDECAEDPERRENYAERDNEQSPDMKKVKTGTHQIQT